MRGFDTCSTVDSVYVDCLLVVLQQWGCMLVHGGKSCKFLNLLQIFMFYYVSIYYHSCELQFESHNIMIIKPVKEISLLIFLILEFVSSTYRLCPSFSTLIALRFLNLWALRFLNSWALRFTGKLRNEVGAGCANGGWWDLDRDPVCIHCFHCCFSSC